MGLPPSWMRLPAFAAVRGQTYELRMAENEGARFGVLQREVIIIAVRVRANATESKLPRCEPIARSAVERADLPRRSRSKAQRFHLDRCEDRSVELHRAPVAPLIVYDRWHLTFSGKRIVGR